MNVEIKNYMIKINAHIYLLLLLLFTTNVLVKAQDTLLVKFPIEVKATNRFGDPLKFNELIGAAKAEELPEVVSYFRTARVYHVIGNVIGLPGAFLFGYSLGYGLTSPDGINTNLLLTGLGMMGFHYTVAATLRDPQMRKGIKKYNEALYQKRKRIAEDVNNEE